MYFRKKILNWRIVFYSRRVIPIIGVNSDLGNGSHCPMLEFDNINFRELLTEIRELQEIHELGEAIIASTGRFDSYHVIFLSRLSWRKCIALYAAADRTDLKHLHFSLQRGHFTLRVTPKGKRRIESMDIICSRFPSDCTLKDLKSYVMYETAVRT